VLDLIQLQLELVDQQTLMEAILFFPTLLLLAAVKAAQLVQMVLAVALVVVLENFSTVAAEQAHLGRAL
jgi:hypothetical protein